MTEGPSLEYARALKCKIIYVPAGEACEYAPFATNPYRGCGHGCAYC
jgi:DNA repair photolyase